MTDFVLAEHLHQSVSEIRNMAQAEYIEWLAFFAVRKAQQEIE